MRSSSDKRKLPVRPFGFDHCFLIYPHDYGIYVCVGQIVAPFQCGNCFE